MLLDVANALNRAGQIVIMTTHDLTLAAGADRIVLLGAEGIVADGPPDQILADREAWSAIGLHVPDWLQRARGGLLV
jgi:energy-coupling factor transporter ATP-binding protein EcfA2